MGQLEVECPQRTLAEIVAAKNRGEQNPNPWQHIVDLLGLIKFSPSLDKSLSSLIDHVANNPDRVLSVDDLVTYRCMLNAEPIRLKSRLLFFLQFLELHLSPVDTESLSTEDRQAAALITREAISSTAHILQIEKPYYKDILQLRANLNEILPLIAALQPTKPRG